MALFYNSVLTSEDRNFEIVFKVDVSRFKKKIKVAYFKRYLSKKEFSFSKKVRIFLILKITEITSFSVINMYIFILF